jgi:hypothetical protein
MVGSDLDLNKTLCEYEVELPTNRVSSSACQHYALAPFAHHNEVRDPVCVNSLQPAVAATRPVFVGWQYKLAMHLMKRNISGTDERRYSFRYSLIR